MPSPAPSRTCSSKTQATTALDDPAFTDRLGYEGQVYDDRVGVYNLTIHTSGSMASVTHVEGDVTATSVIRPPERERGLSTRHLPGARRGQLPDHQWRRRATRPRPSTCTGPAPATTAPQIRFTSRGHFVLDKLTGEVRRNTISTCRLG